MHQSAKQVLDRIMDEKFKTHEWHKAAVRLGANPIFFGSALKQLVDGKECAEYYLALASMEWSGDLPYEVKLIDTLKSPKMEGKQLARLQDQGSKFVLNLSEGFDSTTTDDFSKLFYQDSTGLKTWVLYYNNGRGLLDELKIPNHQLPWKRIYRLPLQYCLSTYSQEPLQWVVSMPNCKDSNRNHPGWEDFAR